MTAGTERTQTRMAEEIRTAADAFAIREYGIFPESLTGKWDAVLKENDGAVTGVIAALNNSDTKHALLGLFAEHAEEIFSGIDLAAAVLNAQEKLLILPEEETALAEKLQDAAAEHGIAIKNEFISVRAYRDYAMHHIETVLALAQAVGGTYTPGTYLCADGGAAALQFVPYGTKLADILPLGDGVKGVQIGSRLYTASAAAELLIREDLNTGDGVITVITDKQCLIQACETRLQQNRETGCGKCTFCREGLNQLYYHISDITAGKGKKEALPMVQEIGEAMRFSCACSVGCAGADFTLDALDGFMSEFEAHIKKRKCPAGVCTCFMTIYIDPQACTGCEDCADVCPADCIEGKAGYIHMIDEFDCTKCGKCMGVCEEDAIISTTGRVPKLPNRLTKVGKFKKRR